MPYQFLDMSNEQIHDTLKCFEAKGLFLGLEHPRETAKRSRERLERSAKNSILYATLKFIDKKNRDLLKETVYSAEPRDSIDRLVKFSDMKGKGKVQKKKTYSIKATESKRYGSGYRPGVILIGDLAEF